MLAASTAAAMLHRTAACGHSSRHPAPRRITPRDASISHVVGTTWATHWKKTGIESTGNTYPDRKIDGITVPITNCPAASVVSALTEIQSTAPIIVRMNGRAIARRD